MKGKKEKEKIEELENNISEENNQEQQVDNSPSSESEDKNALEKSDEKITELEIQVNEMKDKYLRKVAEFENYKRRSEGDQLNLITYGAESFIIKILPVIDDLERSLQHIDSANDADTVKKGITLVYDKLLKVLDEQGVKKMESVGKPFNVDYHDALMQRKEDTAQPHTVLEEVEPGYIYRDKVIRHAKVIVSEDVSENNVQSEETNSDDAVNNKDN
ncbi:MAG: nucleotide exchange factor GrpE [Ignavibacteria bacterium]|nr:nucleotide exchange factor GrpE [Ignavibacteria bacterium]MBT8390323.1 nucleotide exchange factor GrpE [Ignavibacteria bacterium]NNL22473.1 nucleotide exchange factor GrpE [Ignavibacteriaceae bacterium]